MYPKYRVYNNYHKEFQEWGFLKDCFKGIPTGSIDMTIDYCKDNSQQFTGLLDKNGKEIFEGDIVKYIGGDIEWGIGIIDRFWDTSNLYFKWIEQSTPDRPTLYSDISYFGCAKELEIIGNVHETPELLEKKEIVCN